MNRPRNFLTELPYPLHHRPSILFEDKADHLRLVDGSVQDKTLSEGNQRYYSIFESILDLSDLYQESTNAYWGFVHENQLTHLFGNLFHTAPVPSPLHKCAALHHQLKNYHLPLIRFSRTTAAWIWGFTAADPMIHLDFDRTQRINAKQAQLKNILVHQINANPYDTVSFGPIQVTTPLRTLLDLMQYEKKETATVAIRKAINSGSSGISLEMLKNIVRDQKFIQNRARAELLLKHLVL